MFNNTMVNERPVMLGGAKFALFCSPGGEYVLSCRDPGFQQMRMQMCYQFATFAS